MGSEISGQAARGMTTPGGDGIESDTPRVEAFRDSCGDYEKATQYISRLHAFARTLELELASAERANTKLERQNFDHATAIGALEAECAALRLDGERYKRLANIRRVELRRLNKYLGPYWSGFRRGMGMEAECKLRGIMNAAFGHEKVHAAERAAIDSAIRARKSEEPRG